MMPLSWLRGVLSVGKENLQCPMSREMGRLNSLTGKNYAHSPLSLRDSRTLHQQLPQTENGFSLVACPLGLLLYKGDNFNL